LQGTLETQKGLENELISLIQLLCMDGILKRLNGKFCYIFTLRKMFTKFNVYNNEYIFSSTLLMSRP
jgi:hypothetical protein